MFLPVTYVDARDTLLSLFDYLNHSVSGFINYIIVKRIKWVAEVASSIFK